MLRPFIRRPTRRRRLGVLVTALLVGAAGCAGPAADADRQPVDAYKPAPVDTGPGPDPAPTAVYRLTRPLCGMVEVTALAEVFPTDGGKPLAETEKLCETGRLSPTMTVGFSVSATVLPSARWAREYVDTGRRMARSTPTDLPAVGSGAFWTGDRHQVEVVSYDGNLVLTLTCETVSDKHQLPADLPSRLGRVAAGTFQRLAS